MKNNLLKSFYNIIACTFLLCVKIQDVTADPAWEDAGGESAWEDSNADYASENVNEACPWKDVEIGSAWLEDYVLRDSSCNCCYDTCVCSPFWIDFEYLYWKIKESPQTPPLVITGQFDASVTPIINTTGTKIVLGNRANHDHGRSGFKFSLGYCFGGERFYGTEVNYMFLARETHSHSVRSNDFRESKVTSQNLIANSYLAIPFFDVTTGKKSSVYIANPGVFAGEAILRISNSMQGVEWNFTALPDFPICCCNFRVQALIGFRYWNFKEKLTFTTHSPNTTTPDVFTTVDEFKTDNSFYGGQIGFNSKYIFGCFSCTLKAKVALGIMNQKLSIEGDLLTNDFDNFDAVVDIPAGGYFALLSNIGFYENDKFACIPEVNLNISYQICNCSHIHIGYTYMYVSRIFWAENQIDRHINPSQSPAITRAAPTGLTGIHRPKALLKSSDFWAQGFNIGFDYHF